MHTFHLPSRWFCQNQQKLEVIVIQGCVCVVSGVCVCVAGVCVCVCVQRVCVCGVHVCFSKSWSHHTLPGSYTCLIEGCNQIRSSFLSRSDICAALLKAAIRFDKTVTHSQNVLYFKFSVKVRYMCCLIEGCNQIR